MRCAAAASVIIAVCLSDPGSALNASTQAPYTIQFRYNFVSLFFGCGWHGIIIPFASRIFNAEFEWKTSEVASLKICSVHPGDPHHLLHRSPAVDSNFAFVHFHLGFGSKLGRCTRCGASVISFITCAGACGLAVCCAVVLCACVLRE